MKKALSLLCAGAMIATLFAGCGSSGGSGTTTSSDGDITFTVALDSDIVKLDPAFAYDFTTNPVVNQITEGLLTFNENNELVPCLATDWSMTDDKTYVYNIRSDVNFSDGTPMTMDDVLFSLERTADDATASYLQWMYKDVDSMEQTGDWQLTVHLKKPSATWKYVFGTTAGHVISKAYYEAHKDNFGTAEGGLLGTGPFVFDSWTSGQEIVLTRNDNYWDKDAKVDIAKLVFKIIPEDTTRVAALQSGQVDFTPNTPLDMLDTVKADSKLSVQGVDTMGITFLAFNTQRAPFNDVNVRKAIACAIDLTSLHDNIVKDAGKAADGLPQGAALYGANPSDWENYASTASVCTYDLEKAKEYLAQSAYPNGFDCKMLISESSLRYSMALAIQEYLKELNINVELVKLSSDEHTNYQFGGVMDSNGVRDYDMIMAGWEADYPDVSGNIQPLLEGSNAGEGGANSAAYVNDQVDSLISQQSVLSDESARNALLFQALDIVNEDVPYVFLDYPVKQATINAKYTGFTMNASWIWNLYFKNIHPAA
ncbi:MAG: ABC transporter substrate-binding protein [Oscillospiraceae bacterium]|nr:ABC transporter substrate-binding protein [Oscillospiraceae bacterium]